jgi:toxin FitB
VFAAWLAELQTRFERRILPVDTRIAQTWGRLNASTPRNTVDSLIAATALVHGLTVVTRNTADFEGCGVGLLNPWNYQPPSSA